MLYFIVNGDEYKSRKLQNIKNGSLGQTSSMLLDVPQIVNLKLNGGLVEPEDLKNTVSGCTTIETFEAVIGTLSEISRGTFEGCTSLREITIHPEVIIGLNALQNIPSLTKLTMTNLQTIRGAELKGDTGLQEVSFPLLKTVPDELFSGLSKLSSVNLKDAKIMLKGVFKNCVLLETLEFPSLETMNGDSQFEGCSKLRTIDLSKLKTVQQESANIFKGCIELSELKLGLTPPILFNTQIFENSKLPKLILPDETGFQNYVSQSTVNPQNNHYMWRGIDIGIEKKNDEVICPSCPEPEECICPSCPEQVECPKPSDCPSSPEGSYSEIVDISCPEVVCPEVKEVSKGKNKTAIILGVVLGAIIVFMGFVIGYLIYTNHKIMHSEAEMGEI